VDAASSVLVHLPAAFGEQSSALTVDSDPLAHFWKAANDYAKEARSFALPCN